MTSGKRTLFTMGNLRRKDFQPRYFGAVAKTVLVTLIAIVPQVVLVPFTGQHLSLGIFSLLFPGVFVFVVTSLVLHQLNKELPRRSFQQICAYYLGEKVGIFIGAARILSYALLIMLGVQLALEAIDFFIPNSSQRPGIASALVIVLAIPALIRVHFSVRRWFIATPYLAFVLILLGVGVALGMEFTGNDLFASGEAALESQLEATDALSGVTLGGIPYEAFLSSCIPAAALIIFSERTLVNPRYRRVQMRSIYRYFIPVLLLIALIIYLAVQLDVLHQSGSLPLLEISALLFPRPVTGIFAAVLAFLGITLTISAYWQLPQILRQLASDNLLPRRFGFQDSENERAVIVIIIAGLAGLATYMLTSFHFFTMVFLMVSYTIGLLTCFAMMARSQKILKVSFSAAERADAKRLRIIFGFYSLFLLAMIYSVAVVSVEWVLWTVLLLLGPEIALNFYNRGKRKVLRALDITELLAERHIPTQVHGFVLVSHLDGASIKAIDWARAMRLASLQALCVDVDPESTVQLRTDWQKAEIPLPLTILGTPAGASRGPIIDFLREFSAAHPREPLVVVVARVLPSNPLVRFFYRFRTPRIINELKAEKGIMLLEVPFNMRETNVEK